MNRSYAGQGASPMNLAAGRTPDADNSKPTQVPEQGRGHATLQGELLQLLANQAQRVPIPIFFGASVIAAVAADDVEPIWPALWLALIGCLLLLRRWLLVRLPTDEPELQARQLDKARWIIWTNGAAQASSLAFFPFMPAVEQAIQSIYLIGLSTAGVAALAGYRPILWGYFALTLGPLAALWAFSPSAPGEGWVQGAMAMLVLFFGGVLVGQGKDAYQSFETSFRIREQHLDLNRRLRTALDEAESANRAKTRFLASASHDLRQPIHTLSLFSAALSMRPLDEPSREIAQHMSSALDALASQLDALLDVSKLDAGIVDRNLQTVHLLPLLARLTEDFKPVAQGKGLQLQFECPRDSYTATDPALLERLLRNLLSNAIKYTESGSVSLSCHRDADRWLLEVRDTGRGIPPTEQARVFEEFYQLDNPERDRSKGLGLGLAIVRRLCDLLEIQLQMESTPGVGTRFSLDLTVVQAQQAQTSPASAIATPPAGLRVLVVDDEEAVRVGMSSVLSEMGLSVRSTDSSAGAAALVAEFEPQLVLADFRLRGDDDGLATIRALREQIPGLPALLISGDTAPSRLREARAAGVPLLHKPVAINDLQNAIALAVKPSA